MRKVVRTFLISSLFLVVGCTAVLYHAIVNSFPDYTETMNKAPPLSPNSGRIIIFNPGGALSGYNGAVYGTIKIDKTYETTVGKLTFVFIDLPAGSHLVSISGGWLSVRLIPLSQVDQYLGRAAGFGFFREALIHLPACRSLSCGAAARAGLSARLCGDCRARRYPSNSSGDGARRARAWFRTRRAGRSADCIGRQTR